MIQDNGFNKMQIGKYILWIITLSMAVWMFNILMGRIDAGLYYAQIIINYLK